MSNQPRCAKCPRALCGSLPMDEIDPDILPEFCPMRTSADTIRRCVEIYEGEISEMYVPATIAEGEAYETVRGTNMAVRPRVKELMRQPVLLDGRNIYDPERMREMGFTYRGMGRGYDGGGQI